jgi:hypothetical protein
VRSYSRDSGTVGRRSEPSRSSGPRHRRCRGGAAR